MEASFLLGWLHADWHLQGHLGEASLSALHVELVATGRFGSSSIPAQIACLLLCWPLPHDVLVLSSLV